MSTIIADNLTGKTAAGNVTVTSEGGAATFQLQQGLAKAWTVFTGTGTAAIDDSLNTSSLTDNGTGDYTLDWSNSFASTRYAGGGITGNSNGNFGISGTLMSASDIRARTYTTNNAAFDTDIAACNLMGDLA
jgi:hypothetical protein